MVDKNDWRLRNQLDYLNGVQLFQVNYQQKNSEWEHDHCEFCWDKFSSENQAGYTTKDKYYWIYTQCYIGYVLNVITTLKKCLNGDNKSA